jgi:hypothetical protein
VYRLAIERSDYYFFADIHDHPDMPPDLVEKTCVKHANQIKYRHGIRHPKDELKRLGELKERPEFYTTILPTYKQALNGYNEYMEILNLFNLKE